MKKFDITPLLPFYDKAADLCRDAFRREEEVAPLGLLEELMDIPGMPMHCPPHHFLMPALLLVLAGRAQKIPYEQFEEDLLEIEERAKEVPGGACGFYGNCGAAVGIGLFLSVYTGTDPHSEEYWGECNLATGRALQSIGEIAGPRCCKRNSFLALISALDTMEEFLHISIPRTGEIRCKYHDANPDCKGSDCPFFHKEAEA